MADTAQKLLLCGPQITSMPAARQSQLHQVLIKHPELWKSLTRIVASLQDLYDQIVQKDDNLADLQNRGELQSLEHWMQSGAIDSLNGHVANHVSLPLTILLQLSMLLEYLDGTDGGTRLQHILPVLRDHGIQGFCAGFLTASAIALSADEESLIDHVSVSLRLSMCIGVYIDADIASMKHKEPVAVLSARWKAAKMTLEEIRSFIQKFPSAYISCITDETCVTITTLHADELPLTQELERHGIKVKKVELTGRFHSPHIHARAASVLQGLVATHSSLQLPMASQLKVPVRSNMDGHLLRNDRSLSEAAVDMILLQSADWYSTVRKSISGSAIREVVMLSVEESLVPLSIQLKGVSASSNQQNLSNGHSNNIQGTVNSWSHETRANHGKADEPPQINDYHSLISGMDYPAHSVAVVGMAGRFPGATELDKFWELLKTGEPMVREAPEGRLHLHNHRLADRAGVKFWGNFIDDADAFDHRFFKKSSREAISWDPEKRILLEVVYEALESAGHFGPSRSSHLNDYGCFIGAVANNYYDNVACHPPNAYSMLGTSRAFFSGRIAHQFGFTGPAMSIDTACSSSLVAINAACRAIQSGECTRAVAGGTNIFTSPYDYQNLAAAGFLSPSGACKPFDKSADGYCRGEGVAAVVLKALPQALEEGDQILGVIVGSAVNQNHNEAHITVPCSSSQTAAYQKALSMANATPSAVTYVEAHGTGTQVGDPIECESIRRAFGSPSRLDKLFFGSVKGSIGHTEATAGVTGLIKVLLMLKHRTILPQAGFSTLNPKIPPLEPDMMEISQTCQPWLGTNRLACINSYGAAGSNAVIALREAPLPANQSRTPPLLLRGSQPLFLSAATEGSLTAYAAKLLEKIRNARSTLDNPEQLLSSFLFQLSHRGNHELPLVVSEPVSSLDDLENRLGKTVAGLVDPLRVASSTSPMILVFGGQEQTFVGLAPDVIRSSTIVRKHFELCASESAACGVPDLISVIHQAEPISHLPTSHAALFATQYAIAKAWIDSGIVVTAVVGHSFGQMTALCIAGCLSLRDAMRLVVGRAQIIDDRWGSERGAMLSIQADLVPVKDLIQTLRDEDPEINLDIACFNHPRSHVLVGSNASIDAAERALEQNPNMRAKRLSVTHGFHSNLCEPVLSKLDELAASLQWEQPHTSLELAFGTPTRQPPGPWLIAEMTRKPVHFGAAVQRLAIAHASAMWLEAGSGSSVMSLVRQNLPSPDKSSLFRSLLNGSKAMEVLAETIVQMWKVGVAVHFWPYHPLQRAEFVHVDLPTYQFEKSRHWLPFVERTEAESADEQRVKIKMPIVHEFISLREKTAETAIFLVDPESERFVRLLKGHAVAGQFLAPGSLYIELLSRATLLLTEGATYATHVTNMDWMKVKGSPIGLDPKKNIFIQLKRITPDVDYWDYEISTRNKSGETGAIVHTTGRVGLKRRDDPYLLEITQRWSALIGYDRCLRLLASDDTEKMQGRHVYTALQNLADFDEMYHGIKSISYQGREAAGKAAATLAPGLSPDEALYDTPTIDGLMQFAGVLVNYFAYPSGKEVLVCQGINEIVTGGAFDITLSEWTVYTVMTEDTPERTVSDAYVFDPRTKQVVIAFMGFVFTRVGVSVLNRSLHHANHGETVSRSVAKPAPLPPASDKLSALGAPQNALSEADPDKLTAAVATPKSAGRSSRKHDVCRVLHRVTDVPIDQILPDVTLEDLGIDSLLVTEVLNELQSEINVSIDLNEFMFFPNVGAVCQHIDTLLGADYNGDGVEDKAPAADYAQQAPPEMTNGLTSNQLASTVPTLYEAKATFAQCKDAYSRAAIMTGAVDFWEKCYPDQAALVLAYVVEAFAKLGVDVAVMEQGQAVAVVPHLDRHRQLVRQLYRVLEDGGLITIDNQGQSFRTANTVNTTPASELCDKIIPAWPRHASVHKIVRAVGQELGACLVGEKDGLQLVFGDKENKKTLDDLYENWPLVRSGTLALGEYVEKLLPSRGEGKFRILEVGGGTGGTTKYIVRHLQKLGIPFEYVFTDLSASLVAAAKRTFRDRPEMQFATLDIEKEPAAAWVSSFHIIISTNCIHATRDLTVSLTTLRRLLRDDGVLTLVEITQNMFWLDIAVGLFEGWWLFSDGREHAVTHESRWKRCMEAAGFAAVDWTDGQDKEAQTIRVIAGFASNQ